MIAKSSDDHQSRAESNCDATTRLRREGRWEEASAFKEEVRQRLRDEGLSRKEAKEAAWEWMLREYPPVWEHDADGTVGGDDDAGSQVHDYDTIEKIAARTSSQIRPPLYKEIFWVSENLDVAMEKVIDTAPSTGAYSLWKWSRDHRGTFYEKLLPKAMAAKEKDQRSLDDDSGKIIALCQKIMRELEEEERQRKTCRRPMNGNALTENGDYAN